MDNQRVIIATDENTLKKVLSEMFLQKTENRELPEFENDKISKFQAAKLSGVTIPTLNKLIKAGKFRQYNLGRKKYFIRSEMLEALRRIG